MKSYVSIALLFFLIVCASEKVAAQNSQRFQKEIDDFSAAHQNSPRTNIILFTGSSSIRIWTNLSDYFPGTTIVNGGFGGSQTTDLLYYFDALIRPFKPKQIFIYEGDNDLNAGKTSGQIIASTDSVLQRIRQEVSSTVPVFFISPKPSIARWNLRDKYVQHAANLKVWAASQKFVTVVDGWTPLLDQHGNVLKDIFMDDGLHLNKKGYDLWAKEIGKYVAR